MRFSLVLFLLLSSAARAAPTCPDGATVPGIDVSKWQGEIDWSAVAASGVRFAIMRTNHGLDDIDPRFVENWQGAKENGIVRGAYQFFWPWQDPIEQAELLLALMGPLEPGDLPPVIDIEADEAREADIYGLDPPPATTSPEDYASAIWAFLDHVEDATGVRPILYSYQWFWNARLGGTDEFDVAGYPFWFANYNVDCPTLPTGWSRWEFWQTSSTGSVPGISGNVDTNLFNGDEDALLALTYQPPPDAGPVDEDAGEPPAGEGVPDAGAAPEIDDAGAPADGDGAPVPDVDDDTSASASTVRGPALCACANASGAPAPMTAALLLVAAHLSRRRRGARRATASGS